MQATEFLSDVPDRLVHVEQGWGTLGYDVCAHNPDQKPLPLQIGSKRYTKGLGSHAAGKIVVDLDGRYATFDAEVGVEKQDSTEGAVIFRVLVDGKKRFDSGVMRQTDAAKAVHVDVAGAQELVLVADPGAEGIICDAADWAEARLTVSPDAKPSPRTEFDLAPFAQVCTWDPKRMDGARASRIEEFQAEDVFLDRPLQIYAGFADGNEPTSKVPANGCIGLVWPERRKPTVLGIAGGGIDALDTSKVQVQAWTGIYPYQGNWKPLVGVFHRDKESLRFEIDPKANPDFVEGFRKVRWILPKGSARIDNVHLSAVVSARMKTVTLRLEGTPKAGGTAEIEGVGCEIGGVVLGVVVIDKPCEFEARFPAAAAWDDGPTQPAVRLTLKGGAVTINVRDALSTGVYLPTAGIFLSKPGDSLAAYRRRHAKAQTILERVRNLPDQTFEGAMKRTYRETHFGSPTLLSVGPDNWKWLVEPNGTIVWEPAPEVADKQMPFEQRRCFAGISFNGEQLSPVGEPATVDGLQRWMPAVHQSKGACALTAFAAPIGGLKGLFVGRIDLDGSQPAKLEIAFQADRNAGAPAAVEIQGLRAVVKDGDRLMAVVDLSGVQALQARADGSKLLIEGQGAGCAILGVPGWEAGPTDVDLQSFVYPNLVGAFVSYWNAFKSRGTQIEIPDKLLSDIIENSQVRCYVDARNRDAGALVAPWIAEIHYGPLESEANTIVRGMALMGRDDFSQKCLDYFINLYNPAGYLTTGYTLVGTGWHLWTLGEAYALHPDKEWLTNHAEAVANVCGWVLRERHKTMHLIDGQKPPQYGLVTPGVIADWNAFHYYFYTNGTYCAGLEAAAKALEFVGYKGADALLKEARAYRKDIVAAYRRTQAFTPAVPLQDGTWVPGQPSKSTAPDP